MTKPLTLFRVHFSGGESVDVEAANPAQAREVASKANPGKVSKIKVVRS